MRQDMDKDKDKARQSNEMKALPAGEEKWQGQGQLYKQPDRHYQFDFLTCNGITKLSIRKDKDTDKDKGIQMRWRHYQATQCWKFVPQYALFLQEQWFFAPLSLTLVPQ